MPKKENISISNFEEKLLKKQKNEQSDKKAGRKTEKWTNRHTDIRRIGRMVFQRSKQKT